MIPISNLVHIQTSTAISVYGTRAIRCLYEQDRYVHLGASNTYLVPGINILLYFHVRVYIHLTRRSLCIDCRTDLSKRQAYFGQVYSNQHRDSRWWELLLVDVPRKSSRHTCNYAAVLLLLSLEALHTRSSESPKIPGRFEQHPCFRGQTTSN